MRAVGYSTGALARGDLHRALGLASGLDGMTAVELSALRIEELGPLVDMAPHLDLRPFHHISVHAPSRFDPGQEGWVVEQLATLPHEWPIVVHPDALHDVSLWTRFGGRLLLENMDGRKRTGRNVAELEPFFAVLPRAGFCLDVAHAFHADPGGGTLRELTGRFETRLVQLHVSTVNDAAEHGGLDAGAVARYADLAARIGPRVVVILESVVPEAQLQDELNAAATLFRA